MPLHDSPSDPLPSPSMLDLVRLTDAALERCWRDRLQEQLAAMDRLWAAPISASMDHPFAETAA